MIVKVCGIKYQDNLASLSTIPIDMIGFNFYIKSKRYITDDLDISLVPSIISKVGVFVNASTEYIKAKIDNYRLDYIQLHGDETPGFCQEMSHLCKVIKAFSICTPDDMEKSYYYQDCSYFLFDTRTREYGGSGIKFDWDLLSAYKGDTPFILAGGIGPEDTGKIERVDHHKFTGVDINSRFEIAPGRKNSDLVESFTLRCKKIKI